MKKYLLLSTIALFAIPFTACGPQPAPRYSFGRYPQNKVTDSNLINTLNGLSGELPSKTDKKKWTSYKYYISGSNSEDFMWYIDIDIDNDGVNDYRGVYFDQYRPLSTQEESQESTSYQKTNGYSINTRYWFKYESIKWQILKETKDDLFLLSDLALDAQQYYNVSSEDKSSRTDYKGQTAEVYTNNYQYSDLRTFLNVSFFNTAFSEAEKNKIKVSTVDNSASSTGKIDNPYAGEATSDPVFALSYQELSNSEYSFNSDKARVRKGSDYAKSQGLLVYSDGSSAWWGRSPGANFGYLAKFVDYNGELRYSKEIIYAHTGILPSIHISKS